MKERYDLTVIGAGPGGYVAAIRAAQLGMNVLVVEENHVGGTCLNRGCIPTKTLMHSSHLFREIANCEALGLHVDGLSFDIGKIYARKDEVVAKLRSGIELLINANKIDLLRGKGSIIAANTVSVITPDGVVAVESDKILIASGSEPALPPIEGIELSGVITSDELLAKNDKISRRLVVIGGGVIGVEFATIFNSLGCEVTVIEALERILPTMDREISQNLSMILKKRGVSLHPSAKVERITGGGGGLVCHYSEKGKACSVEADNILVAVGRRANTRGLFGEGFSMETDRGSVIVDGYFRTSVPNIYAIGDVISGGVQLAHVASAQGCNAVSHMVGVKPPINLEVVPACIYTDPEIASVGMSADQAKEAGIPVKTGKFLMTANGKSLIEMQERGFIKLVFAAQSDILIGAQLMCARATDLISELSTAIANKLTLHQLAAVIRPHPTFTEAVTEAVEDAEGKCIHVAPKKKL